MTDTEIYAEPIPYDCRVGDLEGHTWAAVERTADEVRRLVAVHVPSDDERTLGPERFAAKVAANRGLFLVPLPDGMAWLEPSEGVWVLMGVPRVRRAARGVPTAKRPKPDAAPGFYWPDRFGTRVMSA